MAVTLDPAIRKAISKAMFTVPAADRIEAKGALEIKPGWYRARNGRRIEVVREAVAHISAAGYAWEVRRENGDVFGVTADGRYWSKWLKPEMPDDPADLIERIEDEQPSAIVGAVECSVETGKPVGQYISDAAWRRIQKKRGLSDSYRSACEKFQRVEGNVVLSKEECDELLGLQPIFPPDKQALEAKIARLEAENESLSRQLRSRELNKESATGGKVWRWSPMV